MKFEEWKKRYIKTGGLSASVGNPKEGIALHEEKKLVERIDCGNPQVVQSRLKEYTGQIAGDNQAENAFCITRDGSVYHCRGVSDTVYPDFDLGEELAGAYVTHNHPMGETHFSFSDRDIKLFMEYKLPELIGVDEEYIYTLRRTPETSYAEPEVLEHAYKGENYAAFMEAVLEGEADAEMDEYDFYVRRLAGKYGFEYEREKR